MVNGSAKGQRYSGPRMTKKTIRALGPQRPPRPANIAQSLRRIRNELSLMLSAVDDGLQRIEGSDRLNEPSHKGDFERGTASEGV
jgi:hypothetical protein